MGKLLEIGLVGGKKIMDYVEELIYYFEGNDRELNEIEASLFLNDISGGTLNTEEINNIINEYKKLGE